MSQASIDGGVTQNSWANHCKGTLFKFADSLHRPLNTVENELEIIGHKIIVGQQLIIFSLENDFNESAGHIP